MGWFDWLIFGTGKTEPGPGVESPAVLPVDDYTLLIFNWTGSKPSLKAIRRALRRYGGVCNLDDAWNLSFLTPPPTAPKGEHYFVLRPDTEVTAGNIKNTVAPWGTVRVFPDVTFITSPTPLMFDTAMTASAAEDITMPFENWFAFMGVMAVIGAVIYFTEKTGE